MTLGDEKCGWFGWRILIAVAALNLTSRQRMGLLMEDSTDLTDQHMMGLLIRSQNAVRQVRCRRQFGRKGRLQVEGCTSVDRNERACKQAPTGFPPWKATS